MKRMLGVFFTLSLLLVSISSYTQAYEISKDPYRWLEDENDPKTIEWLADQKVKADAYFQENELRRSLTEKISILMDNDSFGVPRKVGKHYYLLCRLKERNQASLYRMVDQNSLMEIVDPLQYSPVGSLSGFKVSENQPLVAFGISDAGSDWQQWRFKNLDTGEDLPDILNDIKFCGPTWDNEGKGVYYFKFSEKLEEASSSPQKLYYHRLGTCQESDTLLFSKSDAGSFFSNLMLAAAGRYLLFSNKPGAGDLNEIIVADRYESPLTFRTLVAEPNVFYTYVGCKEGRLFFVTDNKAPNGKIISIEIQSGEQRVLLAEGDGSIENACFVGSKLVIGYLKDACSEIKVFSLQGELLHELKLPGVGTACALIRNLHISGSDQSSEFLYPYTDFTRPTLIYRADVETGISEPFLVPSVNFQPENYKVRQVFYPSKDGTLVPMFIASKKDLKLDGRNPLLLYGYGGFNVSVTPTYNSTFLTWMELGGVLAVANIRGGGEYGEPWHRAGSLANKQNSFDDFISAAQWLCEHKYTQPSQLAINGRSNGGLLTAACLIQRPDLFGVAIVDVGVLDMLRFHLFTVGKYWIREFGSPDDPEDAKRLFGYSPYHQVKAGEKYPSVLITTADHDDRVVPLHSYKFAAAMQESQAGEVPILLRVYENAGHGAGKSIPQALKEKVDYLYFLMHELQGEAQSQR